MFKTLIRQMEWMYRIDELFASNPGRRFRLEQVAGMLGCTIRTVGRLYDVMFKMGAPLDTNRGNVPGEGIGTRYGDRKRGWRLDFSYPTVLRISSGIRMRQDQIKAMNRLKKERSLTSLIREE
jgi:hypothetical protein